jgi:hypothetical protein
VTVLPATAIVAVRAAPPFTATRYSTEPSPLPEAPDVTVSQLASAAAVHAQSGPAATWIVPVELSEPTVLLAGETVNSHGAGGGVGVGIGKGNGVGDGPGLGLSVDVC